MVCSLVSIYFDSLQLDININTNCIKFNLRYFNLRYSILVSQKRVWEWFVHQILCMIFQEKWFLRYILLTKFHSLIVFISSYVGQYMYWNYFCTRLWRHKILNQPYLSNQVVFLHVILRMERVLKVKCMAFSSFFKGFHLPKIDSDLRVCS